MEKLQIGQKALKMESNLKGISIIEIEKITPSGNLRMSDGNLYKLQNDGSYHYTCSERFNYRHYILNFTEGSIERFRIAVESQKYIQTIRDRLSKTKLTFAQAQKIEEILNGEK